MAVELAEKLARRGGGGLDTGESLGYFLLYPYINTAIGPRVQAQTKRYHPKLTVPGEPTPAGEFKHG